MRLRSIPLFTLTPGLLLIVVGARADEAPTRGGGGVLDIRISRMNYLQQMNRDGTYPDGVVGLGMSTTSCNVGTVDVPWKAPMNTDHPFIIQNLYRESNGVLEQIGAADAKHGFYAVNASGCGQCQHPGSGLYLGPNCDDTYGAFNNADRTWMAPRGEINPFTGVWDCVGSHFAGGEPDCIRRHSGQDHTPTEHMIEVHDGDLGLPGATYYYEGYYVVAGDQDKYNNIGWRTCTTSWDGAVWQITTTTSMVQGPVINSWGDSRSVATIGEGEVILAVKTSDLGGGWYHYEYALYNHDLERRIRSFSLPVALGVNLGNVGFHDPDRDQLNDWAFSSDSGVITWQTETFAQNPEANALIYGTVYNVRFDADAAPVASTATLGLFKPGIGVAVLAETVGPPLSVQDCNGNGTPDEDDIAQGTSPDCNGNLIPDECEPDCNGTGAPDNCDITAGTSVDCQPNGVPDECELAGNDCNGNLVPDYCDIIEGTSQDCQPNGVPDSCDLEQGTSSDINGNALPDECEPDCNNNGVPDFWDISQGTSADCDSNGVPDECDPDCNENGTPDQCDIDMGTSEDLDGNNVPDECDCRCGDLNHDGSINLVDFLTFAGCFGIYITDPPAGCSLADARCSDFDANGFVDLRDFVIFAQIFGQDVDPSQCRFSDPLFPVSTPDTGL